MPTGLVVALFLYRFNDNILEELVNGLKYSTQLEKG